jgi:CHAT domain-containing protein/Tfp pilus assembly protein PilF
MAYSFSFLVVWWIRTILFAFLWMIPVFSGSFEQVLAAAASEMPLADEQTIQGLESFRRGDFERAIQHWTEAARIYDASNKPDKESEVLTYLAEAYQSLGEYRKSLETFQLALNRVEKMGDRARIASIKGSIGNGHLFIGQLDKAEELLNESLALASEIDRSSTLAAILNNLGNLYVAQGNYNNALGAYEESTRVAKQANNPSLVTRVRINAATASSQKGWYAKAEELLTSALAQVQELSPSHDKAYQLIHIGQSYRRIRPYRPQPSQRELRLRAFKAFKEASRVAESINDSRALSYALGYLGQLYEEEHRYPEALQLTRRAILAIQPVDAPEVLYRWQWQTGRLLRAQEKLDDAISAYRLAIYTLQPIRYGLSVGGYGRTRSSFRETVGPVFFELADLLLQRTTSLKDPKKVERNLVEARETIERLKAAELQDYFQDECVSAIQAKVKTLDTTISQNTAVVYPFLLPDRTELLLTLPTGLKRFVIKVSADTLSEEVKQFRGKLEKRTTREYLLHAQRLYDWLIRPLEPELSSQPQIDTLVFVPDGLLRTIPMAALHDGKRFLIEIYALAITPGLQLTDPRPIRREKIELLVNGLTESVQGFPALEYADEELRTIHNLYRGKLLENQTFLLPNIEQELSTTPYSIVHIASHGLFKSDVRNTFVLTFDGKLTMDRLEQFVGLSRFRDKPVELLTLSACQTAAGDERAALGLAGIAIKAGARSALATLWFINDEASSVLIEAFYRQLQDPSISKAKALQNAQIKLLKEPRYAHPGYWSPFLLIGNWL